jgi:hypothetical protein
VIPLPGMPEPPPRRPKPPRKPGVQAVRTRSTKLCQQCTEEIHRFGQAVAPYPRLARWRVSDGETVERLCEAHKNQRCNSG